MPRAFLIKKKVGARCPTDRPPKKLWTSTWIDSEMEADEDNSLSDSNLTMSENSPIDSKGPYDLSLKTKITPSPEVLSINTDMNIKDIIPLHHGSFLSSTGIIAPKPIKPEPKSAEEIAALKASWQQQMYTPYLALNHPSYLYSRPEASINANGYFVPQYEGGIVPLPVALSPSSTAESPSNRDKYSPTSEKFNSYDVSPRERDGSSPPAKTLSPSPPIMYSGWISDSHDSGLASSPSPSSEDGDLNSRQSRETGTRYECPNCNKTYSTYSGLSKHRLMHCTTQVKKSFSCKHCDKVYMSLGALKMHIRTHTLPCRCTLCGKAFSRPWLLNGHIRTHTGEKPFSCQHCSRAFADRSNLRAHLQTHSEIKKYRCKTCSKTFSRMSLLLKHEDGGCSGATTTTSTTTQ